VTSNLQRRPTSSKVSSSLTRRSRPTERQTLPPSELPREVHNHVQLAVRLFPVSLILHRSVLLPYVFARAGWGTCMTVSAILALLSYFCCLLIFESSRLQKGNFKMRQKIDFESLLSSELVSKSLAVSFARQLFLVLLVCSSSIGIVLSTYVADNLFETANGETYAL